MSSHTKIVLTPSMEGKRLTVNPVDDIALAQESLDYVKKTGQWDFRVGRGEVIDRQDDYRATGEAALVVTDPNGLSVVWIAERNLHEVGPRAMAESCIQGSEDLWDKRIKNKVRLKKAEDLLKKQHGLVFSPLEKLAASAEID